MCVLWTLYAPKHSLYGSVVLGMTAVQKSVACLGPDAIQAKPIQC